MNLIHAIVTPPTLDDIVLNARARTLHWIVIGLLGGAMLTPLLPLFTESVFISWPTIFAIIAIGIALNLLNLYLLQRGAVNIVGVLLLTFNWIVFMGIALMSGGVQSPTYTGIIPIAMMAVLFLGQKAGLIICILGGAAGAGMIAMAPEELAQASGLASPIAFLISILIIAVITSLIAGAATRTTQFSIENLIRSEARYRMLIQELPDGILIIDSSGNITMANPGAARLLGYTVAQELIGLPVTTIFDSAEMALNPIPATAAFEMGQIIRGERIINQQGGQQITILGSARQMPDGNFQFLFQDITAWKENEAEREEMIVELEAKNAELERFTYTVSHDLKSPLISIRTFVGYLREDLANGDDKRVDEDLYYIDDASQKMNLLLNDLLELSRIGRLMNPPEWLSYAAIVQEALTFMDGRFPMDHFSIQIDADLPLVYGDRKRLTEVVQNLLVNSVKFMGDQPQPQLHIGHEKRDDTALFFVRDNGIGIPPAYHEKIFNLFDRLDPTIEGTGIGLSLVKRIIEVHGGEIWVESAGNGQGSTFYFTLPWQPTEPTT